MIQSMTGYGASVQSSDNYKVSVELKSLNSKFLEINFKMPKNYLSHELTIRNLMGKKLLRGKIAAMMTVEVMDPEKIKLQINEPLVGKYAETLQGLRDKFNIQGGFDLPYLLSLPDAIINEHDGQDEEELDLIISGFKEAVKELIGSRMEEGKALAADMRLRIKNIGDNLLKVQEMLPARSENVRQRILNSLNEVKNSFEVDQNRFEQELIYYIEKLDINEEIVRLKKHLEYFLDSLDSDDSNGKKLGFISQEMGREINTIGSKANDADIQVFVVKMKEELEKIKEQTQNVL